MAILPVRIDLDSTWKEISTDIFNVFKAGEKVEFFILYADSQFFELLVDTSGIEVIDTSFNNKGTRLDQYLTLVSVTLNLNYRYYARSLLNNSFVSIKPSALTGQSTIVDAAGRSNTIGLFGEQWATDIKNDILAQFSYGKSTRDLKNEIITSTGTVTIKDDNLLTVSTGTDIDGLAEIESYNSIRYRPGHTAMAQFTALFTEPTANNTHQWIGVADGTDGFAFGFIDGIFSITLMRKDIHTHITDLNGNIDIADIDFTKLNLFRITYGYLGIAPISFEIIPKDGNAFVPIHTIRLQGIQ